MFRCWKVWLFEVNWALTSLVVLPAVYCVLLLLFPLVCVGGTCDEVVCDGRVTGPGCRALGTTVEMFLLWRFEAAGRRHRLAGRSPSLAAAPQWEGGQGVLDSKLCFVQ